MATVSVILIPVIVFGALFYGILIGRRISKDNSNTAKILDSLREEGYYEYEFTSFNCDDK